MKIAEKEAK